MPEPASADLRPTAATEVAAARAIARLARFAERALGDLSLAHYRVLSAIASGDGRASRVAAKFALGKPTISATVDALCRKGMISKAIVDTDQRASALELTDEGRTALERAEQALVAALYDLVGTDDAHAVIEMLATLGIALEGEAQARDVRPPKKGSDASAKAAEPSS